MTERDGGQTPQRTFRTVEMAWLQAHAEELGLRHPGEWIAIDGPELVAHARDVVTLMQLAREAGHPHPFVTAVPASGAPKYFIGITGRGPTVTESTTSWWRGAMRTLWAC